MDFTIGMNEIHIKILYFYGEVFSLVIFIFSFCITLTNCEFACLLQLLKSIIRLFYTFYILVHLIIHRVRIDF